MTRILITLTFAWCFATNLYADPKQHAPTNSLAFHLQSLGRTSTPQEREIIEHTLELMYRCNLRSDFPLRSIKRDDTKKEWILFFDSLKPDAALHVYIRDNRADKFEVQFPILKGRVKYQAEKRKSQK